MKSGNAKGESLAEKGKAFWDWFASVKDEFAFRLEGGETEEIARVMAPRIAELSKGVGWEIGPGERRPYLIAITLNGSLENLKVARHLVSLAPPISDWEIHVGRPVKKWDGRFLFKNREGQEISIDSSQSRYVLTGYDGNSFFDISVIAKWPRMDRRAKLQAASLVIQNTVGELAMLERFDEIVIVESPTASMLNRSSLLRNLREHLEHIDQSKTA
jgi:hypothetical protein